jgi:hypothetical protein
MFLAETKRTGKAFRDGRCRFARVLARNITLFHLKIGFCGEMGGTNDERMRF